ncbi:MAG: hypothetical protein C0483_11600 [Pirellula sp.]|nr:hypothetical protein [Pirellula sp.]
MKINSPSLINTAGLLSTALLRGWMNTLDCRWVLYDRACDTALDVPGRRRIYLFWHEYVSIPLDRRGHTNVTMLLSRHRDADVLNRMAMHQGFGVVRGSTFDGASTALRELIQTSRKSHITITPDGPRGPRRQVATGPIYLASKLGMPIVPMGYGFDRPWRLNSWDRFAFPRPFSRARAVWGPEMVIPKKLDRDGLEHYRREVQRMINRLTLEAEAWAESGTSKIGELPYTREVLRPGNYMPQRAPQTFVDHPAAGRHAA